MFSADQYEESARETMRIGQRFTYRDLGTNAPRVGYYAVESGRFTALRADESIITSHFIARERYVRELLESTYP